MSLRPRRHGKPLGSAPGTVVHVGAARDTAPVVRVIDYTPSGLEERGLGAVADCKPLAESDSVTWIDVDGVHDVDLVSGLGEVFRVHPLVLEDIANTTQRPKLDEYPEHLFLVVKMIYREAGASADSESGEHIRVEQVSLVVGSNYVLSFQERPGDVFEPVRERIRGGRGRIRRMGPDYLAYALLDAIVDNYFPVLEHVGDRLEAMEESVMGASEPGTLARIYALRRELIYLRKSLWPLREVVGQLRRSESGLVTDATVPFLADVHDHSVQIIESVESYRDLASGLMDLHLSATSNRTNDVMKVLTLIATIFMPLGFLAGLYGMNFENMPELRWTWGYPALLCVMAGVAGSMLLLFRRRGWLG